MELAKLRDALSTCNVWTPVFVQGAATTVVKASAGRIGFLIWKLAASSLIEIYDDPSTTNNQVLEIDPSLLTNAAFFGSGMTMANGITVVTTGAAATLTIGYL